MSAAPPRRRDATALDAFAAAGCQITAGQPTFRAAYHDICPPSRLSSPHHHFDAAARERAFDTAQTLISVTFTRLRHFIRPLLPPAAATRRRRASDAPALCAGRSERRF